MSEATPSRPADRNLLFGILALQMDFIQRDALIQAMNAWVLEKNKPLGQILEERGALSSEQRSLLEPLVQAHLKAHGNDPEKSLASVSSVGSIREDLKQLADPDVQASLARLSQPRSAGEDPGATRVQTAPPPSLRFRILRPHAKGGLGEVFVAEDQELHRQVALKEIQTYHAHKPESRARFLLEAEITGGLEHPGIVPVYGLGHYADGRPFYAMRFIRGDSLEDAIARFHQADQPGRDPQERNLALRDLLGRFVDVCNAVGYAHARGVLHRDLKPGNVMLGRYGETLVVDWGLAKPLGHVEGGDTPEAPLQPVSGTDSAPTQMGEAIGTPAYMSPEQAAGRLDQLGPATDIYGLGATLYSLLTGQAPFPAADGGAVLQKVQKGDFPRPRQVKASIPVALEAICQKAMALRPEDRYVTPRALADDVEHWLADEPVTAYREPWLPRLARWGRRHRPLVAGAAALLLTTVAALAVGVVAVNREKKRTEEALAAESQARQRTREALDEMSSQVIEDWLSQRKELEPAQRAFLEKALAYYEAFAAESGQTEEVRHSVADAHLRVGKIRYRLGQHGEAEVAYRRAQELYVSLAGDFPTVTQYAQQLAASHNNLGILLKNTGRPKEAEAAYHDALATQKQLAADFPTVPEYRLELARSHNNLGGLLSDTGRPKEAEAAYRDALVIRKQLTADFPSVPEYRHELAAGYHNLGTLLKDTGRPKDAEIAYRDALTLKKQLATDFPTVAGYRHELARSHGQIGLLLADTGRQKEAEVAYRDALTIYKQLAADFPTVPGYRFELGTVHSNLGILLANTGRPKDAEIAFRDGLTLRKQLATDFPTVPDYRGKLAQSYSNLSALFTIMHRPKEAEVPLRDALAIQKQLAADFPTVPDYRRSLAISLNNLGDLPGDMGRPKEAEVACRDALAIRKQLAADFPNVPDYQNQLADTMVSLGNLCRDRTEYAAAQQWYEEALPYHQAALQANPRHPGYRQVFRNNREGFTKALIEMGEHSAAGVVAYQFLEVAVDPAKDAYKAACFLARCVPLAEKDKQLSSAKRKELVQSYADKAMAALRQAIQNGYKDVAHMRKDTDLDALRSRADFKKLLAELEKR